MMAGSSACTCAKCGAVCSGRFNGCPAVWERGPVASAPRLVEPVVLAEARTSTARRLEELTTPDFTLRPRRYRG